MFPNLLAATLWLAWVQKITPQTAAARGLDPLD